MKDLDRHPTGLLAAHAGGELDRSRARRVAEHLAGCASCCLELERWEDLYQGLAHLPRPRPPEGLRARILAAVAREALLGAVRARAIRRRWVAALSWAYASGVALAGSLMVSLALVPEVRQAVGSAIAQASAVGLRAGLIAVEALSRILAWTGDAGRFLNERMGWLGTVARAFDTLGGVAEMRFVAVSMVLVGGIVLSALFLRFLHRPEPKGEVSHVGPLLA